VQVATLVVVLASMTRVVSGSNNCPILSQTGTQGYCVFGPETDFLACPQISWYSGLSVYCLLNATFNFIPAPYLNATNVFLAGTITNASALDHLLYLRNLYACLSWILLFV
jgi:hypothetical protein